MQNLLVKLRVHSQMEVVALAALAALAAVAVDG